MAYLYQSFIHFFQINNKEKSGRLPFFAPIYLSPTKNHVTIGAATTYCPRCKLLKTTDNYIFSSCKVRVKLNLFYLYKENLDLAVPR